MSVWKVIVVVAAIFLFPAFSFSSGIGDFRVSLIEGDAQMTGDDLGEWVPLAINTPLKEGDRIWVPDGGRIEIQVRDGTFVRLDEGSSLDILTLERDSYQFYLSSGHIYVNYRGISKGLVQVDTPVSSLRAYDRSVFRVDVSSDGYTDISVFSGSVFAEDRNGKTRVQAGKRLTLRDGSYAEISALGPADGWERWNRDRDQDLAARRYSTRYLPDELEPYSSDFDDNGRWVYAREYGYVWTPTVHVSVGWAPYRQGRWVWVGGDYVWISYEPWGWAPYHFGRWAFVGSIGWCWVPPVRGSVYWGPGFVGWVSTPTYVAWVPLAPGEIYYGYGYYGPHSVNIVTIDIHRTEIKSAYRHVHVSNAVTVIHRDTFITGRHTEVRVGDNPFLRERISIGRPDIKPERSTLLPIIKDVPRSKQPPPMIRDIQPRELKEKRPLGRDRRSSVMRPDSPQKVMPVRTKEGKALGKEPERRRELPREGGVERGKGAVPPAPAVKGKERQPETKPLKKEQRSQEYQPKERREAVPAVKGKERQPETKPGPKAPQRAREETSPGTSPRKQVIPPKPETLPVEEGIPKNDSSKERGKDEEPRGAIKPRQ